MWAHTNNAFIAGYEALITAYEAEHPDVDIQLEHFDYELYLQTLQTAMPAGEEADIIQLFGTWTSQYYERLAPVPPELMTLEQAQQIFYAAPIGGYVVDGVLYGLPQEFNCEYGGVLVNKSLFEAAGLGLPAPMGDDGRCPGGWPSPCPSQLGWNDDRSRFPLHGGGPDGVLLPGRHPPARR